MYRQYVLVWQGTRRVGWIDREPALKRGVLLTVKGDARVWAVEHAGTTTRVDAPDMTWQVGGIKGRMPSVIPGGS